MALFQQLSSIVSGVLVSRAQPTPFTLGGWLMKYSERKNRDEGVVLRNELAKTALTRDQILILYQVCRDDPNVILVLDDKVPLEPFTAQDIERLVHNESAHGLMAKFTSRVRDLARSQK